MEKTQTKTGTKNSKEYKDRWWKPLVNPPITHGEWIKYRREG